MLSHHQYTPDSAHVKKLDNFFLTDHQSCGTLVGMRIDSPKIKRLIRAKYPTQKAFADVLDIDLAVLATILHREQCGDEYAKKMAKTLGVSLKSIEVKQ